MDVFKGRGPSGVSLTESDAYGVQVKRLDHDSPFYESKLMPGMILLSIQGHAGILKMAHASRLLQEADSPVTILTAKTLSSIDTHYIKLKACNVLTTGINTGSGQYMLGIRFAQVCSVLVRVSFLADNSPLHGQLKVGDIILSINGQAVSHPDHAARLVRSTNHAITDLGGTVVFQVWDVHAFLIQHVVVPALTESGLAGTNNAETFQRSLRYDELWKEMYLSYDPSYRFVVDEEYLRVSHKEPWRHFKSSHVSVLHQVGLSCLFLFGLPLLLCLADAIFAYFLSHNVRSSHID